MDAFGSVGTATSLLVQAFHLFRHVSSARSFSDSAGTLAALIAIEYFRFETWLQQSGLLITDPLTGEFIVSESSLRRAILLASDARSLTMDYGRVERHVLLVISQAHQCLLLLQELRENYALHNDISHAIITGTPNSAAIQPSHEIPTATPLFQNNQVFKGKLYLVVQRLESLVAAGCDVFKATLSGETALHRAAQFNLDDTVTWLLEKGSNVSAKDAHFNTPLHIAASFNAVLVIETLLSHDAQLNAVTVDGQTSLHCASQAGANDSVIALLDAGADPNKTDGRGHTPLATAIFWGKCKPSTINILLEHTEVDWNAPRASHLVFIAALAIKSPSRASVLESVIQSLRSKVGQNKTTRIIKRLMPEMVPEIVVSADDSDRGSPADVIPPLLDFLPENKKTRHLLLFHMLLVIIKHGGDDDGNLTRRLLLLDDSNVSQEIPRDWGFQGLCCRYGRLKQLRVFLGRGLNPWGRSMVDGVMCTTEDIVKQFSPDMLGSFQRITDGADMLRSVCIKDPSILPMLGRMYPPLGIE
ncbi:hypothetical protein FPOA_06708 [Fusarium poae]|uniref:Prion-inhibition and propagation HeLo domain-containing protein n=1 Tax=Fusarium poae TaxID=36050 RepID=A0A1B8AJ03_FUSPO|nr:hypothetical protein FPOA_06708 [Fusarium poae]